MGKVTTELTLTNHADEILVRDGSITDDAVRSVVLSDVLVDTGATTLCLPQSLIEKLSLHSSGEVTISTANGIARAIVYEDVRIEIAGRSGTFDCIGLPDGCEPLLGVIPLERLGLEPDLQNQRLRVLPDTGRGTYLLAPTPIT